MPPVISIHSSCAVPCNLCGCTDIEVVSLSDRKGNPLRTVLCKECGLVWTDPRPNSNNIEQFYSKDYRKQYKGTTTPKLKHVFRAGNLAIQRLRRFEHLLSPNDRVLDAGSGGGELVYLLQKLGYRSMGIDANEGYARYSIREYGIDVQVSPVQHAEIPGDSLDLITHCHVLEHLEDPCHAIRGFKEWLKPGGFLVVEVPNVESFCHAPGNRFHIAHLYNFNPNTLEALGMKAGLEVVESRLCPHEDDVHVIFRKTGRNGHVGRTIQGNYERVRGILRRHTNLKHYVSRIPYARLIEKIRRQVHEKKQAEAFSGGRELLDHVYEQTAVAG